MEEVINTVNNTNTISETNTINLIDLDVFRTKRKLSKIEKLDKKVTRKIKNIYKKYKNSNPVIQFFVAIYICAYFYSYKWIIRNIIKNKRIVENTASIVFIATILILTVAKIYTYYNSFNKKDLGREKYYVKYEVSYDDTLWDIASDMTKINPEYNSVRAYKSELMKTNGCSETIKSGQTLLLPYYSTDKEQAAIIEKYIMQNN